jgi:hypothetical protein
MVVSYEGGKPVNPLPRVMSATFAWLGLRALANVSDHAAGTRFSGRSWGLTGWGESPLKEKAMAAAVKLGGGMWVAKP